MYNLLDIMYFRITTLILTSFVNTINECKITSKNIKIIKAFVKTIILIRSSAV